MAPTSSRGAGGKHDYFSEADYFWPDPKNPDGPYIQRDGMSNPNNLVDHCCLLMRLSLQVPELTAAWRITREQPYAVHTVRHLRAWFIDLLPDVIYDKEWPMRHCALLFVGLAFDRADYIDI